jgi:pimeloyl-ACP methyl ester carboxylesterase
MKNKILMRLVGWRLNLLSIINPTRAAREAFYLFCYPVRVPLPDYQLAFLNEARDETFTHHKDTVQTYRWGNGERKVLLLHGWRSHAFRWKRYIEALSAECTVYALDAPGHGLSSGKYLNLPYYSDVIEAFIRKIGGVDMVVGHSIGGFASLYALHRTPSLPVEKLVLMGVPGRADEFVGYYQKLLGLSDRTVELMLEYFENKFGKGPDYFSSSSFAKSIRIPGIIIHDEEDAEAPVHHAYHIHEAWKQSELHVTQGLGHNLKSDEVVKKVYDFAVNKMRRLSEMGV